MEILLGFLPAALCVGGMFLCFRMMSGGHSSAAAPVAQPRENTSEVASLRDEVARLRNQLDSGTSAPSADRPATWRDSSAVPLPAAGLSRRTRRPSSS